MMKMFIYWLADIIIRDECDREHLKNEGLFYASCFFIIFRITKKAVRIILTAF